MAQGTGIPGGFPQVPPSVWTDGETITGNGTQDAPLAVVASQAGTFPSMMDVGFNPVGTVVAADIGNPGQVVPAKADLGATAFAVGIYVAAASGEHPIVRPVTIKNTGIVELTTAQWDALTGESGGLTVDERYYVSAATAGHLVGTPPSTTGTFQTLVGIALSTTQLLLQLSGSIGPHA